MKSGMDITYADYLSWVVLVPHTKMMWEVCVCLCVCVCVCVCVCACVREREGEND